MLYIYMYNVHMYTYSKTAPKPDKPSRFEAAGVFDQMRERAQTSSEVDLKVKDRGSRALGFWGFSGFLQRVHKVSIRV